MAVFRVHSNSDTGSLLAPVLTSDVTNPLLALWALQNKRTKHSEHLYLQTKPAKGVLGDKRMMNGHFPSSRANILQRQRTVAVMN